MNDVHAALLKLAVQFDEMSQAARSEDEYDRADVWRNAAEQTRFRAKEAAALQPARGDGAVAWQWRYIDPVEGPGAWTNAMDRSDAEVIAGKPNYEVRELFATPSAAVGGRVGEEAWTGEVDCCDAKGMWLVMADDCPLVPGQKVRVSLDTITKEQRSNG